MGGKWLKKSFFFNKIKKIYKKHLTVGKNGYIIESYHTKGGIPPMAGLFRGTYEHQLDDKNRLRIPAKFKKGLTGEAGEKTYSFARGMNKCIYVFPDDVLDELIEELSDERLGESNPASLLFFSNIFPAEEDAQGRVVLPSRLKAIAGIKKDIVTVGRGKRLEIWSEENYNAYIEGLDYDKEFKSLGI